MWTAGKPSRSVAKSSGIADPGDGLEHPFHRLVAEVEEPGVVDDARLVDVTEPDDDVAFVGHRPECTPAPRRPVPPAGSLWRPIPGDAPWRSAPSSSSAPARWATASRRSPPSPATRFTSTTWTRSRSRPASRRVRSNLDKGVEKGKVTAADRDAALVPARRGPRPEAAPRRSPTSSSRRRPERMELKRRIFADVTATAPAPRDPRVEHVVALDRRDRRRLGPADARRRHALLQSRSLEAPARDRSHVRRPRPRRSRPRSRSGGRWARTCIVVNDSPGFATSRLGIALGLEAMRMVEEGVASAADIDTAMEKGYGHAMGPLTHDRPRRARRAPRDRRVPRRLLPRRPLHAARAAAHAWSPRASSARSRARASTTGRRRRSAPCP